MPIYEYECQACSHRFERIQKFTDGTVRRCPECGGSVERLISSPAIRFKGSGWYVTDYSDRGKRLKEEQKRETSPGDKDKGKKEKEGSGGGKDKKKKSSSSSSAGTATSD